MRPSQTLPHHQRLVPFAATSDVRFRVRYCECDPMGVAHHAAYIPWLEIGRTELLRASGISYAQLEAEGTLLVIVKLDVRYRRPIRYDDTIEIHTRWAGGSRVKIEHAYEVRIVEPSLPPTLDSPIVAAIANTTLGCVDRAGAIQLLPPWLVFQQAASTA